MWEKMKWWWDLVTRRWALYEATLSLYFFSHDHIHKDIGKSIHKPFTCRVGQLENPKQKKKSNKRELNCQMEFWITSENYK